MKRSFQLLRATLLAACALGGTGHLAAQTYQVSFLGQADGLPLQVQDISGSNVVGAKYSFTNNGQNAYLWNTSTGSALSLNPGTTWASVALGTSSDTQVGYAHNTATPDEHALLWHGTSASFVDLNPAGFYTSLANSVSGSNQVGNGAKIIGGQARTHALLWHGTAASALDLNPAGYISSTANDVDGDNIAGTASVNESLQIAGMWKGAAHTFTSLQPAGYADTFALGISQNSEVGYAFLQPNFVGDTHAMLWHGTAASAIDLNPASVFTSTTALDVSGNFQVGYGYGSATSGYPHALLWQGTAASVIDLQSLLGPGFVSSFASGVDANGVIVGLAVGSDSNNYVTVWSPIPEPSSAMLGLLGIGLLTRRKRRLA